YANLRPLERVRFTPAAAQGSVTVANLPPPLEGYARYVFVDGRFTPALSTPAERAGVRVDSLSRSPSVVLLPSALALQGLADARFALLNEAFATDGAAVRIASGTDCPACLELVFVASADAQAGASYPRVELEVEAGARLGIVERHVSVGSDASFVNSAVDVHLARGASVQHYRLQETGARATWFDTLAAVVAENATYRVHSVGVGGLSARSTLRVQLAGERAELGLFVGSLGRRAQVQDTY